MTLHIDHPTLYIKCSPAYTIYQKPLNSNGGCDCFSPAPCSKILIIIVIEAERLGKWQI